MILDGKALAESIIETLMKERESLGPLSLGVIMSKGDKATESFVKIKRRVAERLGVEVRSFPPEQFAEAFLCDGVIVQLPLPNADAILSTLPPQKDVDGLTASPLVRPPVAGAVAEIFSNQKVEVAGKKAVVVGAGRLVGAPTAALLRELGAEVSVITETNGSLDELNAADIVILGAGESGLVKQDMLKEGVVLIDAGTSESAGKLVGDAEASCASVASVFTPVPGGVGPIAVAMIFKNLFALVKKNSGH
jgi:methylenetetrahydrofolate dehydrogenase (NADP+)/methenyltetrahydrofolate cyclohydrolase